MVSKLVCLCFDPGLTFEVVVIQELVAENVVGSLVGHDKLSSGVTSILEWMRSRGIGVCVKQLQDHSMLSICTCFLLNTDEHRLIIVIDVDEGRGLWVPEEHAVFSAFISLNPEPT